MHKPPTDFWGREIKPGDVITYASLAGRSARLSGGVVLDIEYKDSLYNYSDTKEPPVLVVEIESGKWDRSVAKYVPCRRKTRLYFPERTVVMDMAPDEFWKNHA